jgi:hypothetical protein
MNWNLKHSLRFVILIFTTIICGPIPYAFQLQHYPAHIPYVFQLQQYSAHIPYVFQLQLYEAHIGINLLYNRILSVFILPFFSNNIVHIFSSLH